ncbi:uncharacterized protein F13E9.13, mitochondrial-like isoform X2 [Ostrea edulis]|uniref:uncharacterized protein F13E9.13, mitochondrial-like isoform X2 n=1 Tax=Ostrea edulis TaxID=37623 RepID=UPI0020945393|nr:uncharacterized protein F13E9.13, mitochondrial-like isoform X2 [Ostrea edulis]
MFLSKSRPLVIGMIHVPALPGTPKNRKKIAEICEIVQKEALIYHNAGVVESLRVLFRALPYDIQERAENIDYSNFYEDNKECVLAQFPDFNEVGKGFSKSHAKIDGLLNICANLVDQGILDQDVALEEFSMRKGSDIWVSERNVLNKFHNYCQMRNVSLKVDAVWDDQQELFKGLVFVDGKLMSEAYGCSKKTAKMKSCLKALQTEDYVGIQILAGANKQALAVAQAAELDFVRAEGFVYSHVADEGWMDACAGGLLRFRKQIGAEDINIFTDIKKKHSAHAVTADVSIIETAKAAELFGSDGVIVTGTATGVETNATEVQDVIRNVSVPVLIGSGVTAANVSNYQNVGGLIVGSHFKIRQQWFNAINIPRLLKFVLHASPESYDYDKVFETYSEPIEADFSDCESDSDLDID